MAALMTSAGHDNHHVVAKALERFGRLDDSRRQSRQQSQQRNKIVADAAPYEEHHHRAHNGEGES